MLKQLFNRFFGVIPWGNSEDREVPPEPQEQRDGDIGPPVHQNPARSQDKEIAPYGQQPPPLREDRARDSDVVELVDSEMDGEDISVYEDCEGSITANNGEMNDENEDAQTETASVLSPEELPSPSSQPVEVGSSLGVIVEEEERMEMEPMVRRSSRLAVKKEMKKRDCRCSTCNGGYPPRAGFRVPQQ